MKNLINKSLKILAIIAMMISVSGANKDEAPVLVEGNLDIKVLPRDYITIYSVTTSKENGDCKRTTTASDFPYNEFPFNEQLHWDNKMRLKMNTIDGIFDDEWECYPYSTKNENDTYIIVLNTNFGSYVYEFVTGERRNKHLVYIIDGISTKSKRENKTEYVLPLIDYKK